MRTEVDLTKLTPYQREVLAALVRRLSKNEVVRLLQIIEATAHSAGGISEAMQALLDRAQAVIEELECEHAARRWRATPCLPTWCGSAVPLPATAEVPARPGNGTEAASRDKRRLS